jgi:hypothetical protein
MCVRHMVLIEFSDDRLLSRLAMMSRQVQSARLVYILIDSMIKIYRKYRISPRYVISLLAALNKSRKSSIGKKDPQNLMLAFSILKFLSPNLIS